MADKPLTLDDRQLRRLVGELRALPSTPAGAHLLSTDDVDEFVDYADETLAAERQITVEAHLASCPRCTEELGALIDETEAWLRPDSEQLDDLRRRLLRTRAVADGPAAADRARAAVVILSAVLAVRLSRGMRLRGRGGADPGTESAHSVTGELGDEDEGFLYSIRATDARWASNPIHVQFTAPSGPMWADTWVMLRPDAIIDDLFVGGVRLATDVPPPPDCEASLEVSDIDLGDLDTREAVRLAIASAHSEEDRDAWHAWADRQVSNGRLTTDVRHLLFTHGERNG